MGLKTGREKPSRIYPEIQDVAAALKRSMVARSTEFGSGSSWNNLKAMMQNLLIQRKRLLGLRDVPGLTQYAADQENNQSYDVVSEINGIVTAIDAILTDVGTRIPDDGTYVLGEELQTLANAIADPNSEPTTYRTFTPGQINATKTLVDALIALIDDD